MCFPLDWALKGQNDIQPFLVSLIIITVSCTEQVFNQYLMNSFDLLIKIRNRKLLCNLAREEGSSVSPKQPSGKRGLRTLFRSSAASCYMHVSVFGMPFL